MRCDPSFAPDGSGVYFFSNRDGGFGKDDSYFAHDPGALYFTSEHEAGRGRADIYRIEYKMR